MTRLASGDAAVAIPGTARADEIGEMAGAVQVFKDNMIEAGRLRAEQAEAARKPFIMVVSNSVPCLAVSAQARKSF